jgi:hypothetical protein
MTNILQLKNLPEPWKALQLLMRIFLPEEKKITGI